MQKIHAEPNLWAFLVASLCPAIFGHEIVKAGRWFNLRWCNVVDVGVNLVDFCRIATGLTGRLQGQDQVRTPQRHPRAGGGRSWPGKIANVTGLRDGGTARCLRLRQLDDQLGPDGDADQGLGQRQRVLARGRRPGPRRPRRLLHR